MADAYLQSLLGTGETIRSEARQHPMALIRFALQPILVFIGALVLLAIGTWLTPDGQGLFGDIMRWIDTLLGLVTAGMFILAILWFPIQVFRWTKRRYMVTDRRVLYVDGVLRKNSFDAGLSMITDVGFRQTFLGRKLGYGDLQIATASNRPLHFREIRDALAFKQAIMTAQHATVEARADEILVSKGLAPTAAAPVAAAAIAAAPAPVAAAAAHVAPPPPVVPAWDGSDVPQMHEDDMPALDPSVLGADGTATAAEEPVAEVAAEVAEPVAAVVDEATDAVAEVAEPAAAVVDEAADAVAEVAEPAAAVVDEATDAAAEAAEPVEAVAESVEEEAPEPVEAVVDETTDAAAEAAEPVEAVAESVEEAPEPVEAAVDETTDAVAEAAEPVEEVAAPLEAVAPEPVAATTSHADALGSIDSTVGGLTEEAKDVGADTLTAALASLADERDSGAITEEEFETRKQALLDRL